jgi:hypothetical protein
MSGMNHTLPVLVDGAKTPDLISDDLAYRHFIEAIAVGDKPSLAEYERRESLLNQTQLSQFDRQALILSLQTLREDLDRVDQDARNAGMAETSTDFSGQRRTLLENARIRLATALSEDGQNRLAAFVQRHVKRHIVIYGESQ